MCGVKGYRNEIYPVVRSQSGLCQQKEKLQRLHFWTETFSCQGVQNFVPFRRYSSVERIRDKIVPSIILNTVAMSRMPRML